MRQIFAACFFQTTLTAFLAFDSFLSEVPFGKILNEDFAVDLLC